MSKPRLFVPMLILLLLGTLVPGCVGREKQATPSPTPIATPAVPVSDSEISGIDSYGTELNGMISDISELENIDLGLIDDTTF